jgi:ABC-2 type transport system ATP-binding protein
MLSEGSVQSVLGGGAVWRIRVGGYAPLAVERIREMTGAPVAVTILEGEEGTALLELELAEDEQIGLVNYLLIELGLTLYEVGKVKSRLDEWFLNAVSGLEHRGERR